MTRQGPKTRLNSIYPSAAYEGQTTQVKPISRPLDVRPTYIRSLNNDLHQLLPPMATNGLLRVLIEWSPLSICIIALRVDDHLRRSLLRNTLLVRAHLCSLKLYRLSLCALRSLV